MQHEQITKTIIGCAFELINELGSGFLESVYENAMCIALRQKGLAVQAQHPIKVFFRRGLRRQFRRRPVCRRQSAGGIEGSQSNCT